MKKTYLSVAITISLLLAGCGGKSAEEHYAAANELAAKQQFNAAVIELKSAISAAPENADYRLLLGRIYMQTGDFFSAEKEFSKALENGTPLNEVALDLLQSSYRAENYQAVMTPFKQESALDESLARYASFYRAMAEIEMGAADTLLAAFDSLINAPENDLALFANAVLQIKSNAPVEALQLIYKLPQNAPIEVEALLLRAQLKVTLDQTQEALIDFYRYLELVPAALRTRLNVAQLELKLQQLDKADQQLAHILRFAPNHGLTNYLKAMTAFDKKDFNAAREHIDKAIANRYNTATARILAGLIYYQLGLNNQALVHLSGAQAGFNIYPPAQRLLTALQLQAGEITQAADNLSKSTLTSEDVTLAAATAFELVKAGEVTLANDIVKRIEESDLSQNSKALTILGQLKLELPDQTDAALHNLEQALLLEPDQHDARLTLAASYLRQRDFAKASALADEWLKKPETANAGYNLKAMAALLNGQADEAERLLGQALLANPENPFTYYLLAATAQQQQDSDQALSFLEETLKFHPSYVPALFSFYAITKGLQKDVNLAVQRIEKAQKAHPKNQSLTTLLLRTYQQEQRFSDIIAILEPLLTVAQQLSPQAYASLANAYTMEQKLPQALTITERWFKQDERNLQAAIAHISILSQNAKFQEALSLTEQQLRRNPQDPRLPFIKFALQAELNDHKAGLLTYETLSSEFSQQPMVLFHKGRLQLLSGQATSGLVTLQQSYNAAPLPLTALAIAEIQARDISSGQAISFLEEHFATHDREDLRLYSFYGSLLIEADIQKAKVIYAAMAQKQPENPIVLNNYAWVLAVSGLPKDAQPYAEKALTLLPQHPDIIDTYGKIMKLQGDNAKAAELFARSLAIRPNHTEVQLNYAEALINLEQASKAQEVLESINAQTPEHLTRLKKLKAL